jgi:hypothetical protein
MHHFLVAVDRQVVGGGSDLGFGHAKTLRGARAFTLGAVALRPARGDIG